jgi:molybdopterin-guanine dinucleotide biosynthesis protein B
MYGELRMIPMLGFCGASGSGKTTLVSRVIEELTARGLKVGAIKHHGHPEPLISPAKPEARPKDSDVLAQAGAQRVAFSHAGGLTLSASHQPGGDNPAAIAADFMGGLDLVLVEGFKRAAIDKIEVVAPGKEPMLPEGGRLIALARRGGGGEEKGLPVLDANAPKAVADFVLEHVKATTMTNGSNITIAVNGINLELNPFVANLLDSAIKGMVKRLKGGANPQKIEVSIID